MLQRWQSASLSASGRRGLITSVQSVIPEVHAAASPMFTELIAASDVIIGETLMAKGLGG